jgi:16S rRNA G966 N2-methylase RsmD
MINLLSEKKWKTLIADNEHRNVSELALEWSKKADFPLQMILNQVKGRQIAKSKLPTWYQNSQIIYPDSLALEQCSGEIAAKYKASLFSGNRLLDLTGGLGVDSWAFSKQFASSIYNEINEERYTVAKHNFEQLDCRNIEFFNQKAEELVQDPSVGIFDVIYIDPSRRMEGKRAFRLADLEPNILELRSLLLQKSKIVVIKAAPMLDIHEAIKDLVGLEKIIVISVKNECKELLLILSHNQLKSPKISCVELHDNTTSIFDFTFEEEASLPLKTGPILDYIYDPYASITKAVAFKTLTDRFDMNSIHPNSHLYTSTSENLTFPGRMFKVTDIRSYHINELKNDYKQKKATMIFRNFSTTPDEVIKKLKLKSSEKDYLFFTTDYQNKKVVIVTERIH